MRCVRARCREGLQSRTSIFYLLSFFIKIRCEQLNKQELFSVVSLLFYDRAFQDFLESIGVKSNFTHCTSEVFIDMPNGRGYSFKT